MKIQKYSERRQLVRLSEYHIGQLSHLDGSPAYGTRQPDLLDGSPLRIVQQLVQVYASRVHILRESYAQYVTGLGNARALLLRLRDDPKFTGFVEVGYRLRMNA